MAQHDDLLRLAEVCAARLGASVSASTLAADPAFQQLLEAVRTSDPRFAFERDGRPDAIAAVREALPPVERDLFDAIVEDHACEVAALSEALALLARAAGKLQRA